MRVRDRAELLGRPAADLLVVAIGDRHVDAGVVIRRRSEHQPLFAEAESPSVVVRRADELQIRHLGRIGVAQAKAEEAHAKGLLFDALDHRRGVVVALHGPDPVVHPVLEITDAAVCVAKRPIRDQDLADIGLVVAVRILQI